MQMDYEPKPRRLEHILLIDEPFLVTSAAA